MESQTVLPDDLVNEIFQHLPVKSLARFKCVSKHYKILISSRRFINTVLKRYPEPNNTLLCHCVDGIKLIRFGSFDPVLIRFGSFDPVKHYDVPRNLELSNHELSRVAGTYHGLICFSDCQDSSASVWNPVTNQLRKFTFQCLSKGLFTSVGFGYDAINDDYKVVRVSTQDDQAYNLAIEIFELRNFESRIINLSSIDQVPFLLSRATPVTVDGASHWIGIDPKNNTLQIVRFDMDHEKFVEIPFSTDMPNNNYDVDVRRSFDPPTPEALASTQRLVINGKEFVLGVLNGFLCLFIKKRLVQKSCSEMEAWLMNCKNQDGSDAEWTKLFEIPLIDDTTEGELVINVTTNNAAVIRNGRFNDLEHWKRMSLTLARCRHNPIHQPVAYVESLVDLWPQ